MPQPRPSSHPSLSGDPLSALRSLPALRSLQGASLHFVMSLRFCALCERAGRDPLADLAVHFGNVEAAGAVVDLAEGVTRLWPERFGLCRPCCHCLTPDEATLAAMAEHARAADREGFASLLDGFVRTDRHEALFDLSVQAVAALQGAMPAH